MRFFLQFLTAALFGVLATAQDLAAETCEIEQWMVDLHSATSAFVKNIDSGSAAQKARALEAVANTRSTVSVRRDLQKSGLARHGPLLSQISTRQKVILQSFERYGPARTRATGQVKKMNIQMGELNDVISTLECKQDPSWRPTEASGISILFSGQNPIVAWGAFFTIFGGIGGGLTVYSRVIQKNRRRDKRYPCHLDVKVGVYNQTVETTCLDISLNGVKIRSDAKYGSGTPCTVFFEGKSAAAKVQWSNAEYCGINFVQPLKEAELTALLK